MKKLQIFSVIEMLITLSRHFHISCSYKIARRPIYNTLGLVKCGTQYRPAVIVYCIVHVSQDWYEAAGEMT